MRQGEHRKCGDKVIVESTDSIKFEMYPGFVRQVLVHNDKLMIVLFTWRKGAVLSEHSHPHVQAGFVVSGAVELTVEGTEHITRSGCSYLIDANERHSARALEESIVLDAFTPCRQDYILGTAGQDYILGIAECLR